MSEKVEELLELLTSQDNSQAYQALKALEEMSAESINAETYVAETPVESAVPAETPAEPVAPVEPAVPAETPAESAAPVESAETEKSAETSEDSTDTKQEDADMPKETEAEVVIVEGAAE